jgi:hypothetical protein
VTFATEISAALFAKQVVVLPKINGTLRQNNNDCILRNNPQFCINRIVAHIRVGRGVYRVLMGKPEGKENHGGDPGVDGRIILRWIFRKWDEGKWTGLNWLRIETVGVHL